MPPASISQRSSGCSNNEFAPSAAPFLAMKNCAPHPPRGLAGRPSVPPSLLQRGLIFVLPLALALSGCATAIRGTATPGTATNTPPPLTLQAGDTVAITFPGTPKLNTTQQIHRDGVIKLDVAGVVPAAGLTVAELEQRLRERVGSQLVSDDVSVAVVSSSFTVYVSGAVLHPGTIKTDKPITALEAVMEAGGFDYAKANPRKVVIVRQGAKARANYEVDLMLPLEGKPSEPFYLQPADIIFVPTKFVWF
jgi:polysaccharide export outer membrane protein